MTPSSLEGLTPQEAAARALEYAAKRMYGAHIHFNDAFILANHLRAKAAELRAHKTPAQRVCDCGHSEADHGPGSMSPCQRCSCINPVYPPVAPAQEPPSPRRGTLRLRKPPPSRRTRANSALRTTSAH